MLQYNKAENEWQEYTCLKIDSSYYSAIIKDDNILFIDGGAGYDISTRVCGWNIRNKTWQIFPVMNHVKQLHRIVELDAEIYAIGVYVDRKTLSSV